MLEAMAQQPDALLFIAGEGSDEPRLRDLAPANVRFLGARTDMPDLMNAADAFVLSSSVEGLPTVLLEAAASGLTAVATDVGGVGEAVIHGRTGYVVQFHDLAPVMQRVAKMPPGAMSQAAREHALSHLRMPAVAGMWEQLYCELLQGRSSWT